MWFACTLSFILGLPSLGSSVAFSAATSIATIGLYISYGTFSRIFAISSFSRRPHADSHESTNRSIGLPIALRVVYADRFVRGPFHLGKYSYPIAITAVLWIAFISIVFCLPELNPVNSKTLNYAPVAVGIVLFYALGFWAVSARKWFAGPVKQIAGTPRAVDCLGVSVDNRGSVWTEDEMGVDFAEPVAVSEKPEFSEKSMGS